MNVTNDNVHELYRLDRLFGNIISRAYGNRRDMLGLWEEEKHLALHPFEPLDIIAGFASRGSKIQHASLRRYSSSLSVEEKQD